MTWRGGPEIDVVATFEVTSDTPFDRVPLILGDDFSIRAVRADGRRARWVRSEDTLVVRVSRGVRHRLEIRSHGALHEDAASPALAFGITDSLAFDRGTGAWYPRLIDDPYVMGDVHLEIPPGFQGFVVGEADAARPPMLNARSRLATGGATFRIPYPVRAFGFAIGCYHVERERHAGRNFELWRLEKKPAPGWLASTASILERLESWYGVLPESTFRIVEIPWRALGVVPLSSALVNTVFVPDSELERPLSRPKLAHELAHFWWDSRIGGAGAAATLLTQSMAELSAVLWLEDSEGAAAAGDWLLYGGNESYLQRGYLVYAAWSIAGVESPAFRADLGRSRELGGSLGMTLGPWLLDRLRHAVGRNAFRMAMVDLLRLHAGRRLDMDALVARFDASGQGDAARELRAAWENPGAFAPLAANFQPLQANEVTPRTFVIWRQQDDRQFGGRSFARVEATHAGPSVVTGRLGADDSSARAGALCWLRGSAAGPIRLAPGDSLEVSVATERPGDLEIELVTPSGLVHWSDVRMTHSTPGGGMEQRFSLAPRGAGGCVYGVRVWATRSLCDSNGDFRLELGAVELRRDERSDGMTRSSTRPTAVNGNLVRKERAEARIAS